MIAKKPKRPFNLRLFMSTRRFMFFGIICFVVAFLMVFLFTYPQLGAISELRNKISPQERKLKSYEQKVLKLNQIQSMPEFQQSSKVDEVLPSYKPLLELLSNFNQIAKQTEVKFTKFELSPGEIASPGAELAISKRQSVTGYDTLEVEMTVEGELKQVDQFMNLIERITPLTTIIDFSIQRRGIAQGQSASKVKAEAEILTHTYFYTQTVEATLHANLPQIGQTEIKVLNLIEELKPSEFKQQTQIIGGDKEDLFGLKGLKIKDIIEQAEAEEEMRREEETTEQTAPGGF
ncbi:MAG: hypothetical protein PVJ09_05440 [Candidatus Woesebacteria bacterium]|jgi:Tfp pilus assembly protein PilO